VRINPDRPSKTPYVVVTAPDAARRVGIFAARWTAPQPNKWPLLVQRPRLVAAHRAQFPGSFSADGLPAHAPPVRCTKTARPDLQMCHACQPPPIRDRKLNHDTLAMARVFQQTVSAECHEYGTSAEVYRF